MTFRILLLTSLIIGLVACQPSSTEKSQHTETGAAQVKNLTPDQFKAEIESGDILLLDVRTPREVSQGKIAGAIVLDFYQPDFVDKALELPRDRPVYIYCSAGIRSAEAARILTANGFEQVNHLTGGLGPWVQAGYPLSRE
ncbi:rhodanese-like domain-containing protein [Algoriphagus namhaensis]